LEVDDVVACNGRILRLALDVDDLVLRHLEAGQDGKPDGDTHPNFTLK